MARALKPFHVDSLAAHIFHIPLADIVFAQSDRNQRNCEIYVLARTKADAIERLSKTLFQTFGPNYLRITASNAATALDDSGLLSEEGDVVVYAAAQHTQPIAQFRHDATPVHVADWRCNADTDYQLAIIPRS